MKTPPTSDAFNGVESSALLGFGTTHPDSPEIGDIVACTNEARCLNQTKGYRVEIIGWSKGGGGIPYGFFAAMMVKICATITGHCPRELCTTAEAVEWLVDRHKAATAANLKLDEIRTEKLAAKGLSAEASAVSAARVILRKSKRIADESADEKPDGQEENAIGEARGVPGQPLE